MDVTRDYIDVKMTRENLDDIPEYPWPAGYSTRWYRQGDEDIWLRIQSLADQYNKVTPGLFEEEFGTDAKALSERQCYLYADDKDAIGTASAWFGNHGGQPLGRIHWVAIVPEHQGKGLAEPLLAAVCNRLKSLGHSKTYLTTQTCRISAINLYAKFGFVPAIASDRDGEIWRELEKHIKYPLRF
ncbi:MAG: GNAT family N-acetyltransferase [Phycisphaerales bacterium]|nr:MAG: GNAT family N-acetyltransferase [Phycisphaerales bacterium]